MAMAMDEIARRWMYSYVKRNHWRVAAWYGFDDLIQDGYFWYYSRVKKYPHVTEPRHMMRLFQIRFTQHIHELSNKKTRQMAEVHIDVVGGELVAQLPAPALLERIIAEAPEHLKAVLKALLASPEHLRASYARTNGVRETTNRRFCRIAGIPDTNITEQLRDYLHSCLPSAASV